MPFFIAYLLLIIVCFAVYIVRSKSLPHSFKYLGILLPVTLLIEVSSYLLKKQNIEVDPWHHLYQPIELILIALVYYHSFHNRFSKLLVTIAIPVYIIVAVAGIFIDGITDMNSISFLLESFLLVVFSVIYIYELHQRPVYEDVLKIPFFWVNTGILFYCTGTFFQMGFHHYVQARDAALARDLNIVNQVLNYFLYSCYLKAFLCKTQESSS